MALGTGHQQFSPVHLLKVLLDDEEGMAAGLIERAGGNRQMARAETEAGAQEASQKFPATPDSST